MDEAYTLLDVDEEVYGFTLVEEDEEPEPPPDPPPG